MRVLYLHQYFATLDSAGGTRSFEFARRLVQHGHQVTVITSPAMLPAELADEGLKGEWLEVEGIRLVVLPVAYSNSMGVEGRFRAFIQYAKLAAKEVLRHPADLVFATSTPLTVAIPGLAAHWLMRIPMVFEVRDLWPDVPIAMGELQKPHVKAAARLLEWMAYVNSSRVIALSPGMKEGVVRRGYPAARVVVIPNSSDLELFDVARQTGDVFRRRFRCEDPEARLVVYAGTFGRVNEVSYLVRAAAHLIEVDPLIKFALVGSGALIDETKELARELDVLDRTVFVEPPIPKKELPYLLAAADLTTSTVAQIPALWQHSANKFFDSFAAGKPIAINHEGWQADLLRETGAGLVLPGDDPEAGATALRAFLRDDERRHQAGVAAKELARTRFSRDLLAETFEETLKAAAERR